MQSTCYLMISGYFCLFICVFYSFNQILPISQPVKQSIQFKLNHSDHLCVHVCDYQITTNQESVEQKPTRKQLRTEIHLTDRD